MESKVKKKCICMKCLLQAAEINAVKCLIREGNEVDLLQSDRKFDLEGAAAIKRRWLAEWVNWLCLMNRDFSQR